MEKQFLKDNDQDHSGEAATDGRHNDLQQEPAARVSPGNCADDGCADETNHSESVSRNGMLVSPFRADLLKEPQSNCAEQDQINDQRAKI